MISLRNKIFKNANMKIKIKGFEEFFKSFGSENEIKTAPAANANKNERAGNLIAANNCLKLFLNRLIEHQPSVIRFYLVAYQV
mgnify:CR=1 FL=1